MEAGNNEGTGRVDGAAGTFALGSRHRRLICGNTFSALVAHPIPCMGVENKCRSGVESRDAVAGGRKARLRRCRRRLLRAPVLRPSGARPDGRTSITPNHDLNNFEKKKGRDKNESAGRECGSKVGLGAGDIVGVLLCSSASSVAARHIGDTFLSSHVCESPPKAPWPYFHMISR